MFKYVKFYFFLLLNYLFLNKDTRKLAKQLKDSNIKSKRVNGRNIYYIERKELVKAFKDYKQSGEKKDD